MSYTKQVWGAKIYWTGLSGESKPDKGVVGAEAIELDTGKKFYWNENAQVWRVLDDTAWELRNIKSDVEMMRLKLEEYVDSTKEVIISSIKTSALMPIAQIIKETAFYTIPGIGTGAAYTSGDAFGTGFWIDVPKMGIIESCTFLDLDNEGLAKTVLFFKTAVSTTADNGAFAPTSADLSSGTPIQINIVAGDYVTFSANQMATVTGIQLPYEAPLNRLWVRLVTRGADNIAAGAIPLINFGIRESVY